VERTRTLIVSDDPLARSGLAALLDRRAELEIVGEASPQDAATAVAEVVLWDLAGEDTTALGRMAAGVPVVALVAGEDHAAAALGAGARGVVFREGGEEPIAAALVAASHGLVALEGSLAPWLRPPTGAGAAAGERLTPRELETLELLAEGLSNHRIAERLGVSERTAKFHVESILGKLGAESRSEAIVLAARRGLVTL
jgi:two-component system, NarL family, nitrate/nitrite response regulator NarL